jgi:hypothetical protein
MISTLSLGTVLRREIHLGTSTSSGRDVFVPLHELKKTSAHVLGASGYGKSYWLRSLIRQLIRYNQPFGLIDPHAELFDFAVSALRRSTVPRQKVVLLDPSDRAYSTAFNPLYCGIEDPGDASSLVLEACLKAWGANSFNETPRLETILRGTFRLLIEGGLTLLEAPEVLNIDNGDLRMALRERVTDELARRDWVEFEKWPRQEKLTIVESSRNRLRRFLQSDLVQLMIGQRENALNMRRAIDDGQYLMANLGGIQSPETQRLLGALLVNAVFHAGKQRSPHHRGDWFLIIDECGQFATRDLAESLDQLRKFGVHVVLAGQRLRQLEREEPDLLSAVLTNAKARVVFGGLERPEAQRMAHELFTGQVRGDRIKHRTVQTKFRPVLDTFVVESESWSEGEGGGDSSVHTLTESNGWGKSLGIGSSVNADGQERTSSKMVLESSGGSSSRASGSAHSSGWSSSHGGSTSIVPITRHEEFREETSRQFWTLEEEWERLTARVHGLAKRQALVRIHNGPVIRIRTPDVREEPSHGRDERFKETILQTAHYAQPAPAVVREIERRRQDLKLLTQAAVDRDRPFDVKTFRE